MLVPLSGADEVIENPPIPIHLFAFPKRAVKSVILGARASDTTRTSILTVLKNDSEYRHVAISRAVADMRQYRLHFAAVDG